MTIALLDARASALDPFEQMPLQPTDLVARRRQELRAVTAGNEAQHVCRSARRWLVITTDRR